MRGERPSPPPETPELAGVKRPEEDEEGNRQESETANRIRLASREPDVDERPDDRDYQGNRIIHVGHDYS
ncbi:hypothetical protein NDU88_006712 [Pleurodeles waltl]|uniref:Uncharacterized protein n=1 Tax=Pleurodeles waltl TaxID=8319 RepID=A0AAV7X237_PLEWA|nr:hypothetical protein NDU88_006712 [Pleurodeles waltl]